MPPPNVKHTCDAQRSRRASKISFNSPDRYFEGTGTENGMTPDEYKAFGKEISQKLRVPHDPPPRFVKHGDGDRQHFFENLRALLDRTAPTGSKLVRGYRLVSVRLANKDFDYKNAWKAHTHLVVAHPPTDATKSDKWIYECANQQPLHEDETEDSFLFVPSSRVHAELSDEKLLSGYWIPGMIIGGNKFWCDAIVAHCAFRGRRRSLVALWPEHSIAKRRRLVFLMPHFKEWYASEKRYDGIDDLAEMMGCPVWDAELPFDPNNIHQLRKAVVENGEALADGSETLQLHHFTYARLLVGELSVDAARQMFHAHYAAQHRKMEALLDQRFVATMSKLGYGNRRIGGGK